LIILPKSSIVLRLVVALELIVALESFIVIEFSTTKAYVVDSNIRGALTSEIPTTPKVLLMFPPYCLLKGK